MDTKGQPNRANLDIRGAMPSLNPQLTHFLNNLIDNCEKTNVNFLKKYDLADRFEFALADGKLTIGPKPSDKFAAVRDFESLLTKLEPALNPDLESKLKPKLKPKTVRGRAIVFATMVEIAGTRNDENQPHYRWIWSPNPSVIAKLRTFCAAKIPTIDIGLNVGYVIIKNHPQYLILRAICWRATNVDFLCEGDNINNEPSVEPKCTESQCTESQCTDSQCTDSQCTEQKCDNLQCGDCEITDVTDVTDVTECADETTPKPIPPKVVLVVGMTQTKIIRSN
jgi:hypothetical protein